MAILSFIPRTTQAFTLLSLFLLSACGGSSAGDHGPKIDEPDVIFPVNQQDLFAAFRDTHGEPLKIGGSLEIRPPINGENIATYELYFANPLSEQVEGETLFTLEAQANQSSQTIEINEALTLPQDNSQLKLIASNTQGEEVFSTMVRFLDYTGNSQVGGKGGTALASWEYGVDRDFLMAFEENINGTNYCTLDNGLVMVVDLNNQIDERQDITIDDALYPAFSFDCSDSHFNTQKIVYDFDDTVRTYSALNDAFYYGTVTYNFFFKYLGRPPYPEKMRLRVHYADDFNSNIFWDGEYANFGDELYSNSYGSVSLDIVAHELGHGFLTKNSKLDKNFAAYSKDALTMHEAFADMTGAATKYFYTGQLHWSHGEEITTRVRDLSSIITEPGAIASYLDYNDGGINYYLRTGMLTYPFYTLTQKWGMARSYSLFLEAAQYCWAPTMDLPQGAQCVLEAAINRDENTQDVINAFKAVKIQLFTEGSLAHFDISAKKEVISFTDTSVSSSQVNQWHWDFGDGQTSNEAAPVHSYAQGGLYHPLLTITDLNGHTDSYTRAVDVFSDYCAPGPSSWTHAVSQITINGQVIDTSNLAQYDYTGTVISVNPQQDITISALGQDNDQNPMNWKMWLDVNNDGVFDNNLHSEEIVHTSSIQKNTPYKLDTHIQIPAGHDAGPLRLRITGQFGIPSPCALNAKTTVDVLLHIQP